jgi:hypothetical protein
MYTVFMSKKGVMVKQVHGECYAVFTKHGAKHVRDFSNLDDAIKLAELL